MPVKELQLANLIYYPFNDEIWHNNKTENNNKKQKKLCHKAITLI